MKDLILNVKGIYFDQMKDLSKTHEFRLFNEYWKKRLLNPDGTHKEFNRVIIKKGYPKKGDFTRQIERPWRGFVVKDKYLHPHFGKDPVKVFAILINKDNK